jgi:hypothetical protein
VVTEKYGVTLAQRACAHGKDFLKIIPQKFLLIIAVCSKVIFPPVTVTEIARQRGFGNPPDCPASPRL